MISPGSQEPKRADLSRWLVVLAGVSAAFLIALPRRSNLTTTDASPVLGPSSCAECHTQEYDIWERTGHQSESKLLTRNKEAQTIARALGIRRIKNDARCTSCHFTVTAHEGKEKAVAGVSCESCHGGARDWIDLHDDFGGAGSTVENETSEHAAERKARCEDQGMIWPSQTHQIAETCFRCHTIQDEELVAAGHPTGAGFELVAWSQGEVFHSNYEVDPVLHRRVLYVIGQMLELKHALLALQGASGPGPYADEMATRARGAIASLEAIAESTRLPEVGAILTAVADRPIEPGVNVEDVAVIVADCAEKFRTGVDPESLASIDSFLPPESAFVAPAR